MPSLNLRIETLKTMLGLEEKRAVFQRQLDSLHHQLSTLRDQLFDEKPKAPAKTAMTKASSKPAGGRNGRSKRGALKEQILAALSGAGAAGVKVTELASALGTKAANIHAWFHSTGKRIPSISKVTGGHYRIKGGGSAAKSSTPASGPAKTVKTRAKGAGAKSKATGQKRGELSANILSELESSGEKGIKIKDLAEKLGVNYRNASVWFVTTAKKYPKVKKVGPAHYKLSA